MTTKKTVIIFIIAFFLFPFMSRGILAQYDLQEKLQELVNTELATYQEKFPDYPGGLAMEVTSKQGTFFVSAGMGDNITNQIHFRAASITKTFTAAAILLLHQQGKLNIKHKLPDTIPGTNQPYVPDTPEYNIPYKDSITILDLLHHRAGVFDVCNDPVPDMVSSPVPYKGLNYLDYILDSDPLHNFTFDELVNVAAQNQLSYFIPNTGYHYSNTGYSILSKIIERVSQKSYQQFLMEDIILPMGMQHSSMPVLSTDQNLPEPFVPGYILTTNSTVNVTLSNMSANVGEGTLITTPYDLGHFLRKLLSGQGVLNPHLVNSVMMNDLPGDGINAGGYGCGLTYLNNLGYGHNGAYDGYLSQMAHDPQTGFTVVVFTNCFNLKGGISTLYDQLIYLLENNCYHAKQIMNGL